MLVGITGRAAALEMLAANTRKLMWQVVEREAVEGFSTGPLSFGG